MLDKTPLEMAPVSYTHLALDPDAPETALGWRLAVPFFSVKEMREKYEIHARRGEDGKYILGVMERRSDL